MTIYRNLAKGLLRAGRSGDSSAVRQWAVRWMDTLANAYEPDAIEGRWTTLNRGTLSGAQFFVAQEHGFTGWRKFVLHVRAMALAASSIAVFEAAVDCVVDGDAATPKNLLAKHPSLARQRSTREHRSTLLHYVSANGVEDFRQKTPANIVEIANLLLDAGAKVDAASDAYGGGCTALSLLATSVHPERAGVQIALLQTLLDRGANLHLRSAGNNHSVVHGCIANGQPAAAKFLADLGAPLDLESAAALGRLDVLEKQFQKATAKQIESAFLYACG